MAKWISSKFKGVRYYEHETRRHGVRRDRYYAIRYQAGGQRHEEGLGWASEGWTEAKAALELTKLKEAAKTGSGPTRMQEKRSLAKAERLAKVQEEERRAKESVTFAGCFLNTYFPQAKIDKSFRSWKREDQFFRLWIQPVIGNIPLMGISPIHIERIKKNMADAGRSPRSIQYCLAVIRQVFNHARRLGLYDSEAPTARVKRPSADNRRLRFLTHQEASDLLEAIGNISFEVRDMTLLSLHCGLRAGEIFNLSWGDVDLDRSILTLRDTKNTRTRAAFMTADVRAMLIGRPRGQNDDLVFPARGQGVRQAISKTFGRAVQALGLNEGITDPRQKVCFHTCRHTYASWLIEGGAALFTVKELLGHKSIQMTERYSHLGSNTLQEAVKNMEKGMTPKLPAEVVRRRKK